MKTLQTSVCGIFKSSVTVRTHHFAYQKQPQVLYHSLRKNPQNTLHVVLDNKHVAVSITITTIYARV